MSQQEQSRRKVEAVLRSLGVGVRPIDFDARMSDLGLDSLNTMDLVLSLEDTFGVQVPEQELQQDNLRTPSTVLALFERLVSAKFIEQPVAQQNHI
jgi:acyl carrier protein